MAKTVTKVVGSVVGTRWLDNKEQCKKCWKESKNSKLFIRCRSIDYTNHQYKLDFECSNSHSYSECYPYDVSQLENLPQRAVVKTYQVDEDGDS